MKNLPTGTLYKPQLESFHEEDIEGDKESDRECSQISESPSIINSKIREIELQKQNFLDRVNLDGRNPTQNSIPSYSSKTRTIATQQTYIRRGLDLVEQYLTSIDGQELSIRDLNPLYFVKYLYSLKRNWTVKTWEFNRQCALAVLPVMANSAKNEAINYLYDNKNPFADGLNTENYKKKIKTKSVKSKQAKKQKASAKSPIKVVKQELFGEVIHQLFEQSTKDSMLLTNWLIAGISTGLRPVEWMSTELKRIQHPESPETEQLMLFVVNAKATNARANGPTRTMDITDFHYTTIGAIQAMVDAGEIWRVNGCFTKVHARITLLLKKIINSLHSKQGSAKSQGFTLYSLRHQFASNMRIVRKPAQVAELLGHNSSKSEKTYYGKRGGGWKLKQIIDIPTPIVSKQLEIQPANQLQQQIKLNSDQNLSPRLKL